MKRFIALALVLTGCAGISATDAQEVDSWQADIFACQNAGRAAPDGMHQIVYHQCMQQKGLE